MIELLVVILITGLMLSLGLEIMPWLISESQLTSTGRMLASFIEDARDEAIISGRTVLVEYDLGDVEGDPQHYRSIFVPQPGREDKKEEEEFLLVVQNWQDIPEDVRIDAIVLSEDEEVRDGYYSFFVYPDGSLNTHGVLLYSSELDVYGTVRVHGTFGEARFDLGEFVPEVVTEDSF